MAKIHETLVDERGLVDRGIFVDKDLYQQELEQVFGRCWLFVGHESQISKPNDFSAAYMGEDPVLTCRDSKGRLHAFLNMCRHRGNRICRADYGNAPSFMCTYHGWTFSTDGKLVGVPGFKEAYFEELDRSLWGLVETAQIASYKGLIFATWDKQAPSLVDYLGDMSWYMDMVLDREEGGTEFVPGSQKWTINCNWKFPADNLSGDNYHFPTTHGSVFMTRAVRPASRTGGGWNDGWAVSPGNGHGVVSFGGGGGYGSGRNTEALIPQDKATQHHIKNLHQLKDRLGPVREAAAGTGGVFNIFPNCSYTETIRIWNPKGPGKTEEWLYLLVEKGSPQDVKDLIRRRQTSSHGPSGSVEQDDMSNWIQCTEAGRTMMGKKFPVNQELRLGQEQSHEAYPGTVTKNPSEINQRAFYRRWAEMMRAPTWSEISIDPRTR